MRPQTLKARPVTTQGILVKQESLRDIHDWLKSIQPTCNPTVSSAGRVFFATIGGDMVNAQPGDWVLLDSQGWPYPCDPEVFKARWEITGIA